MRFLLLIIFFVAVWVPPVGSEGVRYIHGDHLGSSSVITGEEGVVVQAEVYSPFGESLSPRPNPLPSGEREKGEGLVPYLFTGKELDASTELYDFGARLYDPVLCRFESRDPVLGNLPYAYVNNNPLVFIDPTGLDPEEAVEAIPEPSEESWGEWFRRGAKLGLAVFGTTSIRKPSPFKKLGPPRKFSDQELIEVREELVKEERDRLREKGLPLPHPKDVKVSWGDVLKRLNEKIKARGGEEVGYKVVAARGVLLYGKGRGAFPYGREFEISVDKFGEILARHTFTEGELAGKYDIPGIVEETGYTPQCVRWRIQGLNLEENLPGPAQWKGLDDSDYMAAFVAARGKKSEAAGLLGVTGPMVWQRLQEIRSQKPSSEE